MWIWDEPLRRSLIRAQTMQPPLRWRHDGAEDYTWKHKSHKTGWDWTLVLYQLAQSLTSLCDPKNCLSLEKRIDLTFTSCQCRSSAPERLRTFPWKKVCWRRSSVSAIDTVMYIHYSYILYKEVRLNLKSGPSYWASRQNRPLSTEKDTKHALQKWNLRSRYGSRERPSSQLCF